MGFKENLKNELAYSGMLVKELAAKSGVNKHSIDCYLNNREQSPSVEIAVKIAGALGVSVEYLVTGKEDKGSYLRDETLAIGQVIEQLNKKNRDMVIKFAEWLKSRQSTTPPWGNAD